MKHIPRFYVDGELSIGHRAVLSATQMHHASAVLRLSDGDELHVFNNKSGEWRAHIDNRKKGVAVCDELLIPPREESGPVLACCLIHPSKFSLVLEKTTELGVSEIIPIISQYTQYRRINKDKCMQTVLSACEQSCRLSVPHLSDVVPLPDFLEHFPADRDLLVGDTQHNPKNLRCVISEKSIFLVGPEGGFSPEERTLFSRYSFVKTFQFGRNILRTETAAVVFLGCWTGQYK